MVGAQRSHMRGAYSSTANTERDLPKMLLNTRRICMPQNTEWQKWLGLPKESLSSSVAQCSTSISTAVKFQTNTENGSLSQYRAHVLDSSLC